MASVKHLGGDRWKVTVSLGERTSTGGYARTYRTIRARNATVARRQAQEIEVELRARSATLDAERATVAETVEAWWQVWSLRRRSPTTRDSYRALIDGRVLAGPLAGRRVREVRPGHIDRWYLELAQGLSPSTVRKVHAVVRQVFDHAVAQGWLLANPAAVVTLPEGLTTERRRVTVAEVRAVLQAAHLRHPARARTLHFAARTGLRRGEVCALAWSRVNLHNLLVTVDQNVVRLRGADGPRSELKAPKGGKAETIPIDEETARVIVAQRDWQLDVCRDAGLPVEHAHFLWAAAPPFSRPLSPDTLTHWMAEACGDAGVRGVRLHDLRHFAGSQLGDAVRAVAGASREDVRRMLRHAQASTTDRYLHAEEDHAVRRRLLGEIPSLLPSGGGDG